MVEDGGGRGSDVRVALSPCCGWALRCLSAVDEVACLLALLRSSSGERRGVLVGDTAELAKLSCFWCDAGEGCAAGCFAMPRAEARAWVSSDGPCWEAVWAEPRVFLWSLSSSRQPSGATVGVARVGWSKDGSTSTSTSLTLTSLGVASLDDAGGCVLVNSSPSAPLEGPEPEPEPDSEGLFVVLSGTAGAAFSDWGCGLDMR
jgi:hypothetical protein